MKEPVEATLARTEEDLLAAYAARDAKSMRSLRITAALILGLCALVVAVRWPVEPGLWTAALPALLLGVLLLPANTRSQARDAWRKIPPALRTVQLSLGESAIRVFTERYERVQPLSAVKGWLETATLFVVLDVNGGVGVWPKSGFDPADLPEVRRRLDAATPLEAPAAKRAGRGRATLALWVVLSVLFIALYAAWRGMS